MNLLSTEVIEINQTKINHIDSLVRSIYRLIIYSRHHLDDDLLDTYLNSIKKPKTTIGNKECANGSAKMKRKQKNT